jgi:hypothetical protein
MTDAEIEEQIRNAICAYCPADVRNVVLARFNKRLVIVAAVVKLGLDVDDMPK